MKKNSKLQKRLHHGAIAPIAPPMDPPLLNSSNLIEPLIIIDCFILSVVMPSGDVDKRKNNSR